MMNALRCKCGHPLDPRTAGLDAAGRLVCAACYLADPPAIDVDGVFAEVTAHVEPRAALLTALGRALGCSESRASRPLLSKRPAIPSESRAHSVAEGGSGGLPDRCYFAGSLDELGPAPPQHISTALDSGHLAREARELAERARADIIRYCRMRARIAARGRKR